MLVSPPKTCVNDAGAIDEGPRQPAGGHDERAQTRATIKDHENEKRERRAQSARGGGGGRRGEAAAGQTQWWRSLGGDALPSAACGL